MNNKKHNPFLNITATHEKALKAGVNIGFFAGLLGIILCVLIGSYDGSPASDARVMVWALIIGPIIGIVIGFIRGGYIWLSVLARVYRRTVTPHRKNVVALKSNEWTQFSENDAAKIY